MAPREGKAHRLARQSPSTEAECPLAESRRPDRLERSWTLSESRRGSNASKPGSLAPLTLAGPVVGPFFGNQGKVGQESTYCFALIKRPFTQGRHWMQKSRCFEFPIPELARPSRDGFGRFSDSSPRLSHPQRSWIAGWRRV